MGRYEWAFELLTNAGYDVCGFDWPGNGKSAGIRGDMPSPDQATPLVEEVLTHFGISPCGILAHSTGGFMAIPLLARRPGCLSELEWVWLSSPLINPEHGQGEIKKWLAKGLARLFPRLPLSTGVNVSQCYHVEPGEDRLPKPEGVHNRFTLRFGVSMIEADRQLPDAIDALPRELSYLISQGAADVVCPPEFAFETYRRIPSSRKALILIAQALHEPFNESSGARFFNPVRSWLRARASKRVETTD
jgi:alpha-beta hydrolase superfamily lysophospholipase